MEPIFSLPELLIKDKFNIMNKKERQDLERLQETYPFAKKIDFAKISNKIDHMDAIDIEKAWAIVKKENRKQTTTIIRSGTAKRNPVEALRHE